MTPTITDDNINVAVRAFLMAVVPAGVEIVQGQVNRVPQPASPDHIVMTATRRTQVSTTTHDYDADDGTNEVGRSNTIEMQLDVYGPNSNDNAQVIATLFRDAYGCAFFAPYQMQPLYCDDGQQMPLVTGEFQYAARWMLRPVLQANPGISTPAEFADNLIITSHKAD